MFSPSFSILVLSSFFVGIRKNEFKGAVMLPWNCDSQRLRNSHQAVLTLNELLKFPAIFLLYFLQVKVN